MKLGIRLFWLVERDEILARGSIDKMRELQDVWNGL